MSVLVNTYILYGTAVDVKKFDNTRFEDELEYCDYLFEVVNRDKSPYRFIFDEETNSYYFGFVIDEAKNGSWDSTYLSTNSFDTIMKKVTPEVYESLDWMLLIHFNQRLETSKVEHMILTVYC